MSSSSEDESSPELETLDISNDKFYQPIPGNRPKQLVNNEDFDIPRYGSSTIQHSLPAYDLWWPFFPTFLSSGKHHNFHRPKLRHYSTGPQAPTVLNKPIPVKNLAKCLHRYQKRLRNKVIQAINDGMTRDAIIKNILLIRDARDLTAKRGELFLFEYSEEYPPVLNQPGMASNVKTIIQPSLNNGLPKTYKQILTTSNKQPAIGDVQSTLSSASNQEGVCDVQAQPEKLGNYRIGFDEVISKGPRAKQVYYSEPKPGGRLTVIENNLYRAPIFQHEVPSCDFIIIRTINGLYIRTVRIIFTVGQTMPLVAIPPPSERSIQKFRLDFSNCYINKLFMGSITDPQTMSLDTLHKYFPDYDKPILKRRITQRGVEKAKGEVYFRGTSGYGSCSLKDLRRHFTPEQYCLNMAMLVARDRLRDLNYTESMINPSNEETELETEVLAAPWNTSRAVVSAVAGKCYLDLKKHLIDPTGLQREGFSCVSWVKSPTEEQQQKSQQKDLIKCNNPPSNQQPLLDKNPLAYKIKQEKLERLAIYQRESQMISTIQSEVLASKEILSSDEEEEEMDGVEEENPLDNSFDEQLHDLDRLVDHGRTTNELSFEKEEEVRQRMLQEFMQNDHPNNRPKEPVKNFSPSKTNSSQVNVADYKNKVLRITRYYKSPEGIIEPRLEIVREPKIIALYVKQRRDSAQGSVLNRNVILNGGNNVHNHLSQSMTNGIHKSPSKRRASLNPMELCRAEGTILRISKSVLDPRYLRNSRRRSRLSSGG